MAVSRNVIKPPNQPGAAGAHVNSSGSLARGASPVSVPNNKAGIGREGSSASLARGHVDITPPNNSKFRFKIEDATMGTAATVVSPGRGDLPNNPMGGQPLVTLMDSAKKSMAR